MNIFISLVFSCATIVSIAGLAFLMSQLLFQKNYVNSDPSDMHIRQSWLYAFCLILTIMAIEISVAFCLLFMSGLTPVTAGAFAYAIGLMLPSFVLYVWLVYRFGYYAGGTKYLLCAIILGSLSLLDINFILRPIKLVSLAIDSIKNEPLGTAIFSTVAAMYQLMIVFCVLYYLIQSIYLYRANKKYKADIACGNKVSLNDDRAI